MFKITKKISLTLLLLFITFSFSGCMGIPFPGETVSNGGKAPERNDSQGVFKTTDGGRTWEHKVTIEGSEIQLDQIIIGSMAIDPENPSVLYLGTFGDGMYKTENGGDSWRKVEDQNGKMRGASSIYDIAVESGNSNIIYAASLNDNRAVLLKSEDSGNSWIESYISTELGKQINRVQIDPVRKNVVYIGTEQGGFIKSQNRGNDWAEVQWFTTGVKDFIVDFNNTKGIIVLTHDGVFKTTDGGATKDQSWTDLSKSIKDALKISTSTFDQISSVQIDNQNPLVVYMTYNNLIFVTRDGGVTWETLKTITPALTSSKETPKIKKIAFTNGTMYYGAGNAIYRSENKGQTWSSFDIPIEGDVKYTVSDPINTSTIYVGSFYETTD
ncbi:MAG: hypothetical protein WC178_03740 [Candidatus Paceibacterota bacterium]